jgi:hypothetical protein
MSREPRKDPLIPETKKAQLLFLWVSSSRAEQQQSLEGVRHEPSRDQSGGNRVRQAARRSDGAGRQLAGLR